MSGFQLSSVEFFASLVVAISSHLCYAHKNAFSAFNWSTLAHSRRFDRYATLPLRTDRAWPRACHIATSNARRRKRSGSLVAVALGARSDQGLRLREMTQIACTGYGGTPTGPTNFTGIYERSCSADRAGCPRDQQISVRPGADSVLAPVRTAGPANPALPQFGGIGAAGLGGSGRAFGGGPQTPISLIMSGPSSCGESHEDSRQTAERPIGLRCCAAGQYVPQYSRQGSGRDGRCCLAARHALLRHSAVLRRRAVRDPPGQSARRA